LTGPHGSKELYRGDIGGTKTNLALFSVRGEKLRSESMRTFPSKRYSGLVPMLQEFLAGDHPKVDAACFGIAGPVIDGKVKTPNLPWMLDTADAPALARRGLVTQRSRSRRLRYFYLGNDEFTLTKGRCANRNKALIDAGTGLGQAI
jgi:glucokinase